MIKKSQKGFSLIVLITTIAVMLIIMGVAITKAGKVQDDKDIQEFIYELTTIKEFVVEYYAKTGVLPIVDDTWYTLTEGMTTQIDPRDSGRYYYIDLKKLEGLYIKNIEQNDYVVNAETFNIYYPNGVKFKKNTYYTLTKELRGYALNYEGNEIRTTVLGNPTKWTAVKTDLGNNNVVLNVIPTNVNVDEIVKAVYAEGDKDISYFTGKSSNFKVGEKDIPILRNGVYTIYLSTAGGTQTQLKKVVVSKIDDIAPIFVGEEGSVPVDRETGIKYIQYVTATNVVYEDVNELDDLTEYRIIAIDMAGNESHSNYIRGEVIKRNA